MRFVPAPAQCGMKPLAAGFGQFNRFTVFVERDGFPDVIHDHLARVAPSHVRFEFLANSRVNGRVNVIVQQRQKFFAFHGSILQRT